MQKLNVRKLNNCVYVQGQREYHIIKRSDFEADYKSVLSPPKICGLGYSIEDAIIIDKEIEHGNNEMPFDYIGLEYAVAKDRLLMELVFRIKELNDCIIPFKERMIYQELIYRDNKKFDHLNFRYCLHSSIDFYKFFGGENEFINKVKCNGVINFKGVYSKIRTYHIESEDYYFDITNCF